MFDGGCGVACYVWATGPGVTASGNKSRRTFKKVFGSQSLDVSKFRRLVKMLDGYVDHYVNYD